VSRPLGVVVDLDDTLFPQSAYLAGAAAAVADVARTRGLDRAAVHDALRAELALGSDRGGTIDRALLSVGVPVEELPAHVPSLVAAFTRYRPVRLELYPGARAALDALVATAPVACLTDGSPTIQRAKLAASGLDLLLPHVVITDALGGRELRKPHPAGLLAVAEWMGIRPHRLLVIGDRPAKDVAVAHAVGAQAIRIRQGEHAGAPDEPLAEAVVATFPDAVEVAMARLAVPAR